MTCEWRKKAEKELIKVSMYCAEYFGKHIAEKFIDAIDQQVERLTLHPELGFPEPLLSGRRRNYRSLIVSGHFKIVYYYDENKDTVFIVDLWDTRREPQSLSQRIKGK